jgi:hypothetical protein
MKTDLESIRASVLLAFSDCHGSEADMRAGCETRNLSFRAPGSLPVSEAMPLMAEACPSYNNFAPELLALLPADAQVTIAREGSVAIYVAGNPFNIAEPNRYSYSTNADDNPKLCADEISYDAEADLTRLWWD